jgi:hypothetical protein
LREVAVDMNVHLQSSGVGIGIGTAQLRRNTYYFVYLVKMQTL